MSFAGTYKMVSSENFDGYLKAVGVGMLMRKAANSSSPTIEITENGDDIHMRTITTFKTIDLKFTVGKEFEEETADGRKCKTTINKNGNKLVQVQKLDNLEATIVRTFNGPELITEFSAGGVNAKRVYKKEA